MTVRSAQEDQAHMRMEGVVFAFGCLAWAMPATSVVAQTLQARSSHVRAGDLAYDLPSEIRGEGARSCQARNETVAFEAGSHRYSFVIGTTGYIWSTTDTASTAGEIATEEMLDRLLHEGYCHPGQPSERFDDIGSLLTGGSSKPIRVFHTFSARWTGPIETTLSTGGMSSTGAEIACSSRSLAFSGILTGCPRKFAFCPRSRVPELFTAGRSVNGPAGRPPDANGRHPARRLPYGGSNGFSK